VVILVSVVEFLFIAFFFFHPIFKAAAFQQGKIPPTPFSAPPPAGAMIPPPPSLRKLISQLTFKCLLSEYVASKRKQLQWAWCVTQVVKCLPSKHKAWSSKPEYNPPLLHPPKKMKE
jgi:hypothetical protein